MKLLRGGYLFLLIDEHEVPPVHRKHFYQIFIFNLRLLDFNGLARVLVLKMKTNPKLRMTFILVLWLMDALFDLLLTLFPLLAPHLKNEVLPVNHMKQKHVLVTNLIRLKLLRLF